MEIEKQHSMFNIYKIVNGKDSKMWVLYKETIKLSLKDIKQKLGKWAEISCPKGERLKVRKISVSPSNLNRQVYNSQ